MVLSKNLFHVGLADSLGPGMIPAIITFSGLKRRYQGRFNIVKYRTPTLYCVWLYGWNQSQFNIKPK